MLLSRSLKTPALGTVVRFCGLSLSFGLVILVDQLLSDDKFGIFITYVAYAALGSVFTRFGADLRAPSMVRLANSYQLSQNEKKWVVQMIIEMICTSIVVLSLVCLTVLFDLQTSLFGGLICVSGALCTALCFFVAEVLRAKGETVLAEFVRSLLPAVCGLLLFGYVWFSSKSIDVTHAVSIYFIGFLLSTLYGLTILKIFHKPPDVSMLVIKFRNFKKDFSFFLVSITGTAAQSLPIILLGFTLPFSEVGIYGLLQRIYFIMVVPFAILGGALNPRLVALKEIQNFSEIRICIALNSCLCAVMPICYLLAFLVVNNLEILDAVVDRGITPALVQIFILSSFIASWSTCSGGFLMVCGFERLLGRISLISVCFFMLTLIVLSYYFGLAGAALSFTIYIFIFTLSCVANAFSSLNLLSEASR